ncbi:MAG: Maf family protein [Eubacteriales bacterium]|nr:Maf family protein [Eubacteriales bacterium]MDD4323576.1 Maf family protein [Eubacteriales bacterium]MDD4541083.1 Maf family protein [Eubacteriales bacterium]
MQKTEKLILASKSPRRQELLQMLTQQFTVITADVDEDKICDDFLTQRDKFTDYDTLAARMVEALATEKAKAVAAAVTPLRDRVILAADTIVVLDEKVLGKPRDKSDAKKMLVSLSGREHQVFTGVHILSQNQSESFYSKAKVRFYPLNEFTSQCIDFYVAGGASLDKAGAYGIQDEGAFFVHSIKGDFFTVMGLPIAETARRLHKYIPDIYFEEHK